jgi:hypothetical protein
MIEKPGEKAKRGKGEKEKRKWQLISIAEIYTFR